MEYIERLKKNKALLVIVSLSLVVVSSFYIIPRYFARFDLPETEVKSAIEVEKKTGDGKIELFEITGQVNHPGVYELNKEITVLELINLAGGFTDLASMKAVHKDLPLSKIVEAGEKIYIPGTFESTSTSQQSTSIDKVNINSASLDDLIALPEIGEATANKIIAARPFAKVEELKNVEGIGEKTYNNLATLVTL